MERRNVELLQIGALFAVFSRFNKILLLLLVSTTQSKPGASKRSVKLMVEQLRLPARKRTTKTESSEKRPATKKKPVKKKKKRTFF